MADDTRLAEACLLLNYSCQSYKEQLLSKMDHQSGLPAQASDSDGSENPINVTNHHVPIGPKIITPPPEHNYAIPPQPQNQFPTRDATNSAEHGIKLSLDQLTEYLMCDESAIDDEIKPVYYANSVDCNKDPLCNLLAVVNCALPCKKSRPTILQRCSNASPKPTIGSQSSLPFLHDHNYCRSQNKNHSPRERNQRSVQADSNLCPNMMDQGLPTTTHQPPTQIDASCSGLPQGLTEESEKETVIRPLKMVAIHLGAGNSHNDREAQELAKAICEDIMRQTDSDYFCPIYSGKRRNISQLKECDDYQISLDNQTMNAEVAVVKLVQQMEDHLTLNCGRGSNLNMKGHVECDASLMCDRNGLWSGVGAISGCRNPIVLAKCLYDHRAIPRPLGLKQPNLLVGSGAKEWMRDHCPYLAVPDSRMISSKAFSTYQKLKSRYDSAIQINHNLRAASSNFSQSASKPGSRNSHTSQADDEGFYNHATGRYWQEDRSFASIGNKIDTVTIKQEPVDSRLDTVGAIAVDWDNNFASAISSGGLLLKYKGRIGQAAVPGAGCWSQDSVAVTTTGVGEYLTDNLFAKKFYDKMTMLRMLYDLGHINKNLDFASLVSQNVLECFEELTCGLKLDNIGPGDRLAGMLSVCSLNSKNSPVRRVNNDDLYLSFAHNTNTMCVGYMSYGETHAHSVMSRKISSEKDGKPVIGTIKLDSFMCSSPVLMTDNSSNFESEHSNIMSDS